VNQTRPITPITIHDRLKDERIRFIRVVKNWKNPAEPKKELIGHAWHEKGFKWDDKEIQEHIKNGGNYGVLGGHGNLIIIDIDKEWLNNSIYNKLPKTFTCTSGGKGYYHFYYFIEKRIDKEKIKNYDGKDSTGKEAGDIVGYKLQALGPNSIVEIREKNEDGSEIKPKKILGYGTYETFNDAPILQTTWDSLNSIITDIVRQKAIEMNTLELYEGTKKTEKKEKQPEKSKKKKKSDKITFEQQEIIDKIRHTINLRDVFEKTGGVVFKGDNMNGTCPFHDSDNGQCLSVNHNNDVGWIFHCFHCEREGDIFTYLMEKLNLTFTQVATNIAKRLGLVYPGSADTLDELKINELPEEKQLKIVRSEVFVKLLNEQSDKATDMIADYIKRRLHVKSEINDTNPKTWYFDGKIYQNHGVTIILHYVRRILQEKYHKSLYKTVHDKIFVDSLISYEDFTTNMEKYPYIFPVQNGLLDIRTRELKPFTPEIYFTNIAPVTYNKDKQCPHIQDFIREITYDEETYLLIQEMIGYMLLRSMPIHKAFILYGSGRNGKGQLQELIYMLLGKKNISNLTMSQLSNDEKFTLHKIQNKYVNISDEVDDKISETNLLKTMIAGGDIEVNVKFHEGYTISVTTTMLFSTNEFPDLPEKIDDAFFHRWILIPFKMMFLPKADMKNVAENKQKFVKEQKPEIAKKISTDDELSGFLNWALDGLDRVLKKGSFSYDKGFKENKALWLQKASTARAFIVSMIKDK